MTMISRLRLAISKPAESTLPLGANYRDYTSRAEKDIPSRGSPQEDNGGRSTSDIPQDAREADSPTLVISPKLLKEFPLSDIPISNPPYLPLAITGVLLWVCYTIGTVGVALLVFDMQHSLQYSGGSIAATVLGYLFALAFADAFWLLSRRRLAQWKVQSESLNLDIEKWKLLLREKDREIQQVTRFAVRHSFEGTTTGRQNAKAKGKGKGKEVSTARLHVTESYSSVPGIPPLNISKEGYREELMRLPPMRSMSPNSRRQLLRKPRLAGLRFDDDLRQKAQDGSPSILRQIHDPERPNAMIEAGPIAVVRPTMQQPPTPYPYAAPPATPQSERLSQLSSYNPQLQSASTSTWHLQPTSPRSPDRRQATNLHDVQRVKTPEEEDKRAVFRQVLVRRRQTSDPSLAYFKVHEYERASAENIRSKGEAGSREQSNDETEPRSPVDFQTTRSQVSEASNWTHKLDMAGSIKSLPLPPQALEEHPALRESTSQSFLSSQRLASVAPAEEAELILSPAAMTFPPRHDSLHHAIDTAARSTAPAPARNPQVAQDIGSIRNGSTQAIQSSTAGLKKENLVQVGRERAGTQKVSIWVDDLDRGAESEEKATSYVGSSEDGATRPGLRAEDRKYSVLTDLRSMAGRTQANESQAVGPPSAVRATPATEEVMMWEIEE